MKKNKKKWFLLIAIIMSIGIVSPVFAESQTFSVAPVLTENQQSNVRSYFDIHSKGNETLQLEVDIENRTEKTIELLIQPSNALTARNGGIQYTPLEETPNSYLLIPSYQCKNHINVQETFELEPLEKKRIPVTVSVPDLKSGVVLGGLLFTPKEGEKENIGKEGNVSFNINTINAYAMAVQIRYPKVEEAVIDFGEAELQVHPAKVEVYAEMKNKSGNVFVWEEIRYHVKKKSGKQLFKGNLTNIKMAPQSVLKYPVNWDYEQIEAGEYVLTMETDYKDETIRKEMPFTIKEKTMNEYQAKIKRMKQPTLVKTVIPPWVYVIIPVLIIVLIFFIRKERK